MNLETTYLGIPLHSPLVVSASPLSRSIDNIRRMEDAGASAIVIFSLFEEQLRADQRKREYLEMNPTATLDDALAMYPSSQTYHIDLDDYLNHIRKAKEAVDIPIIANVNCQSLGSWTDFAERIEAAGADALELNIYAIPTNIRPVSSDPEGGQRCGQYPGIRQAHALLHQHGAHGATFGPG
jgi:dihydroorotate dehydrogenase (fumarate)